MYLYSALFAVPHTRGAQAWITQCYLQLHQCLPSPHKRSPDGASPDWDCTYLIAAYYSFLYPKRMKGWVSLCLSMTHVPEIATRKLLLVCDISDLQFCVKFFWIRQALFSCRFMVLVSGTGFRRPFLFLVRVSWALHWGNWMGTSVWLKWETEVSKYIWVFINGAELAKQSQWYRRWRRKWDGTSD